MVVPLHPRAGILLVGPAQRVKVDAGLHDDRFIEGKPARDLVMIAVEHLLRVADEQLNDLFGRPAAVLLQQISRQLVVFKADHRLDAVRQQLVEQPVVVGRVLLINRDVFIVGQKARPVD